MLLYFKFYSIFNGYLLDWKHMSICISTQEKTVSKYLTRGTGHILKCRGNSHWVCSELVGEHYDFFSHSHCPLSKNQFYLKKCNL